MPPQAKPGVDDPFRTATLPCTSVPKELAATRMPDAQLVDTVMASTVVFEEPVTNTP